ncbi:MAG: bifunctional diguanylate cyclase/phosphodiesterase [Ruminococcus sp.]|nr:bifunctional diguanylate cyclase/phosphodiesterase [Ruminococcus sp.]
MRENSFRRIIQNFIINMENIQNTLTPDACGPLTEPCVFLRIGKVCADFYESPRAVETNRFEHYPMYDCGEADESSPITSVKETRVGTRIVYSVYPIIEEEPWTDEELDRIDVLLKMLFVFNGRSRLMMANYRLTFYDPDMGVYNLKFFFKSIAELIGKREITQYTAMYINLKHFSAVNLQLGRKNGNTVMKGFIMRIAELAGEDGIVARIGGDNFAVLCRQDKTEDIMDALSGTAVTYDENTGDRILISAYAGVYVIDGEIPVHTPEHIMDRMSIALAAAKARTQHDYAFFNAEMLEKNKHQLMISSLFPIALEKEEFLVYYQPKVSTDTYRIVGAEALCRWNHEGRLVSPAEFIPILERGMDICKLDFYMLDHVCRDIRRWLDEGKNAVKVSVNLSRRHLSDMDLLRHIVEIIDRNEVPHDYIEIELTETTTDVEFKDLRRVLSGLQETGISTSVDDFGVGYSSLTLIKDLPWDVLKIDRSLLPEEGSSDRKKESLLKYVIGMSSDIGLECVAEGVETKEQEQLLKTTSCSIIQGFYFDRPLPVTEFETRLDNYDYKKD